MGFFKKIAKVVTAPVTQTAKAVSSVVKGDIKGAASNLGGAYFSQSPLAAAETVAGTNITGAKGLAEGDFSSDNLKKYAATGAAVAGGTFFGPAGALAGYQLGSGNIAGAAKSGLGAVGADISGLVPGDVKDFGNQLGNYASLFGNASKPSSSPIGNFTPSVSATPSRSASGESGFMGVALLGLGALVIYKLAKRKRG